MDEVTTTLIAVKATGTVIEHDAETAAVAAFLISLASTTISLWNSFIDLVRRVPGGAFVIDYIKASHKNDPWRTLFEALLALVALFYFFSAKYSQDDKYKIELTKKEKAELIAEWEPEPLVPELINAERWLLDSIPRIKGSVCSHSNVIDPKTGKVVENVLNFTTRDFLDMSNNEIVKADAISKIKEVGVGACGPPNFYGTQDSHVRVCEDLARFLGAEKGIIYGQDFCTATSVLPCFLKRGDIVVVDGGVSLTLQKAVLISRCSVEWYNHNDLDHLERILASLKEDLDEGPIVRRFIVTEGLFENFGDSPDLNRIVELKNKFKFRLILDETHSIGVLGKNGRGLPEACGVSRDDVEITMGSLALSFGASGGFCVGCHDMIYHQILSSNAYVFSAALPPYCAKAASAAIKLIENGEKLGELESKNTIVDKLHSNISIIYKNLENSKKLKNLISIKSKFYSPSIHIRINPELRKELVLPEGYGGPGSKIQNAFKLGHEEDYFDENYNTECYLLQKIVDKAFESKILLTRSKRILHHELLPTVPELIISITSAFNNEELEYSSKVIIDSIFSILNGITAEKFDDLADELAF